MIRSKHLLFAVLLSAATSQTCYAGLWDGIVNIANTVVKPQGQTQAIPDATQANQAQNYPTQNNVPPANLSNNQAIIPNAIATDSTPATPTNAAASTASSALGAITSIGNTLGSMFSPQKQQTTPAASTMPVDRETKLWNQIKDSSRVDDYEAYLKEYPNGTYAGLARNRMKSAKRDDNISTLVTVGGAVLGQLTASGQPSTAATPSVNINELNSSNQPDNKKK